MTPALFATLPELGGEREGEVELSEPDFTEPLFHFCLQELAVGRCRENQATDDQLAVNEDRHQNFVDTGPCDAVPVVAAGIAGEGLLFVDYSCRAFVRQALESLAEGQCINLEHRYTPIISCL